MSIFILLNNYFHDFAVALLFSSMIVLAVLERHLRSEHTDEMLMFADRLLISVTRLVIGSWIFIIFGGVIRTLTYAEYEWSEAAGRGQVTALIVKHILLLTLVVVGTRYHLRLRKKIRNRK